METKGWFHRAALGAAMLVVSAFSGGGALAQGAGQDHPVPVVGRAVKFSVSPPLRELKIVPPAEGIYVGEGKAGPANPPLPKSAPPARAPEAAGQDPYIQQWPGIGAMPVPSKQWDGVSNVNGVYPPDTEGDVGPNHYVQWVNLSLAIWDKEGNLLLGPVNGNTLWQALGGACFSENDGDPIVLYDALADRWLISQFVVPGPYYQAIAVSQTPDPLGAWYLYCFQVSTNKMNDYPHFGIWPDGYYMTVNQFLNASSWAGAGVFVFDREKMLAGDPSATFQYFDVGEQNMDYGGMLPSHMESLWNLPPAGAPNYVSEVDAATWITGYPSSALRIWECHVDWDNPANSTFGAANFAPNQVLDTPWTPLPCVGSTRNCIPQPGTTQKVDSLGDRLMYRLNYRNWPSHESLVVSHAVLADGADRAGVRWYELRRTGGAWSIHQQGTYAPADSEYRWMSSAGMDHMGDIAVGYSVSSGSVYPSVRIAGRLVGDPPGELTQGETSVIAGSGSQLGASARWGDYSTMSIDPSDDCTFWYTQEYIETTGNVSWKTRIAAFKFPTCTPASLSGLTGTVTGTGGTPLTGATVTVTNGVISASTTTGAGGAYNFALAEGSYTVSASAWGYLPSAGLPVTLVAGATATQDIPLSAAPSHTVSGVVRDAATHWPLYAKLAIPGIPGGAVWTDPVTGVFSLPAPQGVSLNMTVSAWVPGYDPATQSVVVPDHDVVSTIDLPANLSTCTAPGYSFQPPAILSSGFEGVTPPALPAGWAQVAVSGTAAAWTTTSQTVHPSGKTPHGGAVMARFNSYSASGGTTARLYRTGSADLSGTPPPLTFWMYHDTGYSSYNDRVQVQVSTDGGSTWQNVGSAISRYDGTTGWKQHSVALTGFTGPASDARLGLLGISAYGNDIYVDDLLIGEAQSCAAPASGGLAVGYVYDANTLAPLAGSTVSNGAGGAATTATTVDPNTDNALYCLFSPEGSLTFTASKGGYSSDSEPATVPHLGAVRRDFHLGAGYLAASPSPLAVTVPVGQSLTAPLTLSNSGAVDATFSLAEFQPLTASRSRRLPYKLRSVEHWDPSETAPAGALRRMPDSWNTGSDIPTGPRYRSAGVSPDGRYLYVFGGADSGGTVLAESWRYDSQSGSWTRLADMPVALMNMEADAIGGVIYLVGGYTGGAHTNNFLKYEVGADAWSASTWPNARTPMTAAVNGKLYAFGGNPGPSQETWMYDPAGDSWTGPLASMPTATAYGSGVAWGSFVFAIGGSAPNAQVQRFDPATNTWDASGPVLPQGRMSAAASTYGGLLYVSGGGGNGGDIWTAYGDTQVYDPSLWPSGSWVSQGEAVPTPVVGAACGCVSDRIAAVGGTSAGSTYATTQLLNDGKVCSQAFDIPWLSESPVSGTVPAGGALAVDVTFDATGILTPGVYRARLGIAHNTPYSLSPVEVTMTVGYPPVTATASASTTSGTAPLTVNFTGSASGGDGGPYAYDWDFGDGSAHSSAQNPSHTYGSAGSFTVILTATDGHAGSGSDNHLGIVVGNPVPSVTGVSPSSGPTAGGTTVTVTGTNFIGATAVTFGGTSASSFTVDSATQITATSPAHAAATVDVRVTTAGGTSAATPGDHFTFVSPPAVTALSPTSGGTSGGTSVSIYGAFFTGVTAVSFGSAPAASYAFDNDGLVVAVSPAHAVGTVDVRVTTPYGTSAVGAADQFAFVAPPAVTGVSPTSGPSAGGTLVTLTGTDFAGATAVIFGGTAAASYTVSSATQITATSPAHDAGAVDVQVTTPFGTSSVTAADRFTFVPPPAAASVAPAKGSTAGGAAVSISGTGFLPGASVLFGTTPAGNVSVLSGTLLSCTSPAHASGTVSVTVTNPDGQNSILPGAFTYIDPPVISAVQALSAPLRLKITGSNFHGACTIKIDGTAVSTTQWKSSTLVKAKGSDLKTLLPKGVTVQITVTNDDDGITSAPFSFTR
jgi:PKD repeat protein/N-acetylneuraminic acid mutarotase